MKKSSISLKYDFKVEPIRINKVLRVLSEDHNLLDLIKARDIWDQTDKGDGIITAVIDSGIENHRDLAGNVIGGYNFTEDDGSDPYHFQDYIGHGTHVAGIIAASPERDNGVVGVAPRSKLLILKVINKNGVGNFSHLIQAIDHAMNWVGPRGQKVSIINMSLGGSEYNEELHRIIKRARKQGIVLVAAAGNEGDGKGETVELSYPGFYKEVIQVGSISKYNIPSSFSNSNVNLDIVGPGEDILSTHLNNNYAELTGTSMAAPFVAGAAALIIKKMKDLDTSLIPMYVYHYLLINALNLPDYPLKQVGNGFLQLS